MVRSIRQDINFGMRQMRRNLGITTLTIATFTISIGATSSIFTIVDHVLLRPLPYQRDEQLVALGSVDSARTEFFQTSAGNWRDWADQNSTFSGMAVASPPSRVAVSSGDDIVLAGVSSVSPAFFSVLRPPIRLGRLPTPDEVTTGDIVVISERLWRQTLNGDPTFSSPFRVGERRMRVVGVVRSGAEYPAGTEVWVPTTIRAQGGAYRNHVNWLAIGRLLQKVSVARAQEDLNRIAAGIRTEEPTTLYSYGVAVKPLREVLVAGSSRYLALLLGAVLFVLLNASTNIAAANLGQIVARRRELALRAALGADRRRLIRQLLIEQLLPALAGGTMGSILAIGTVWLVKSHAANIIPRASEIAFDTRVLLFTLGTATAAGLLAGLAPAIEATRQSLYGALESGQRSTAKRSRSLPGSFLISVDIAVSVVLLAGAMLLIRSFQEVIGRGVGFDAARLVQAEILLPPARYENDAAALRYWESLFGLLLSSPGIESVGAANWVPLGPGGTGFFEVAGREEESLPGIGYRVVTDDYLATLGIALLMGRGFMEGDVYGSERVGLINHASMQRHFGGASPLGQRVRTAGMEGIPGGQPPPWITIIGVVADVRHYGMESSPQEEIYVLYRQVPSWARSLTLVARGSVPAEQLLAAVQNGLRSTDPQVVTGVEVFTDRVERSLAERRLIMSLMTAFGAIALVITAIGIYGVINFGVAQRTRELGIRSALGATPDRLLRLVLGEATRVIAAGIGVGLLSSFFLTRLLKSLLVDVRHDDPGVLMATTLLLVAVSFSAALLPGWRAVRIGPAVAMRLE